MILHTRRPLILCLIGLLLLLLSGFSHAVTPQSGWWWNPAEGGRGYTIEEQNGSIFFAGYMYDPSGRATWYAAGPAAMSGSTFNATLTSYAGGQTLTGTYRSPTGTANNGTVSITFTDASHGTLTWPGGVTPIQRFDFGSGGAAAAAVTGAPETGWWWNAAEGGRGFTIEVQNGSMFLAGYMYDASGNPIWYASGPTAMASASSYQGVLQQYGSGQTLTGAYQGASLVNSNLGSVSVTFDGTDKATMVLPGNISIPLTRYSFGGGYQAVKPTVGDTYIFSQTNSPVGAAAATFGVTRYFKTVNADGSGIYTHTIDNPNYVGNSVSYDANGQTAGGNFNNAGAQCTYSPSLGTASPPYYAGKSWNRSSVGTCTTNGVVTTYNHTSIGSITALETVSMTAGTFTALKEVFTTTSVQNNLANAPTTSTAWTRWRDVVSGRLIKYQYATSTIPSGSTTATLTSSSTIDLTSYDASGIVGSAATAARFAGAWSASFSGTDSGTCATITITTAGTISGTCNGALSGAFSVSGNLTTQAIASFGVTGSGFSGQGLTPVTGNGTWISSLGGSGTWVITHK